MPKQKKSLDELIDNLEERAKELNCMYAVEEILQRSDASLDNVFNQIVTVIPSGMQFPEICKVKIVYQDFIYHRKGIYKHRWGKAVAPHYVCIVGYNDNPGYWIVKNSWGTKYQDNGWFNIKYGECSIEKKSFILTDVYGKFPINYVDDDNIHGPWDGSKENPYQYIQDGIDNAYDGYTVFVKNGLYHENIIINKTINLDGENNEDTIIDGNGVGHVIEISVPNVKISGFTIQNSGNKPFNSGIKTLSLDSNITIINNIVQDNYIGIFLNYAYENSWNIIKENIIHNNDMGIFLNYAYPESLNIVNNCYIMWA